MSYKTKTMKKLLSTETIFPLVVLISSLFTLKSQLNFIQYPIAITSLIGIIGVTFYFLKLRHFTKFLYFWLAAQIIIIEPIWDLSQIIPIKIGLTLNHNSGIYLNLTPILLFGLVRILQVSEIVGETVTFRKGSKNNKLGNIFPVSGKVEKRVSLSKEKDWLYITLDEPVTINDLEVDRAFIKTQSGNPLRKKGKGQLSYFRVVSKDTKLDFSSPLDKKDYKFIDWVITE